MKENSTQQSFSLDLNKSNVEDLNKNLSSSISYDRSTSFDNPSEIKMGQSNNNYLISELRAKRSKIQNGIK